MNSGASRMICSACGAEPKSREEPPLACPAHGLDDGDHLLQKQLSGPLRFARDHEHPFARYRDLLHVWHAAREEGASEAEWDEIVARVDDAVGSLVGAGVRRTPLVREERLGRELGVELWSKDETVQPSGSHKIRHLFATGLWLCAFEQLGLWPRGGERPLAIASCGNAALAAATLARAIEYPLDVFLPPSPRPSILARLGELGARITVCPRRAGEAGDPSVQAYRAAVQHGALPFTVQGPENALAIESGATIGYEIVESLAGAELDHVFVQTGGGALASALIAAFEEAGRLGVRNAREPRWHAVQTAGVRPLERAFGALQALAGERGTEQALALAARKRSSFMRPWDQPLASSAWGILDDETYDWRAVCTAMLRSGGGPITASEAHLAEARALANRDRQAPPIDATGAAGLAGLLAAREQGIVSARAKVLVLWTGIER